MAEKIIKLASRSRKNRMFYDNLIMEMAICINCGDTTIYRDLEMPSYRGMGTRKCGEGIDMGNHQAMGFDTPATMLPKQTLDRIDNMLQEAKQQGLNGCNSQRRIADFIMQHTDLTDCHLTALNQMRSLK